MFRRRQFEPLDQHQNAIIPDRCYFTGDEGGIRLRFGVEGEVSPTIVLDLTLATEMYRSLHDYLRQIQEVKANAHTQPQQPTTN